MSQLHLTVGSVGTIWTMEQASHMRNGETDDSWTQRTFPYSSNISQNPALNIGSAISITSFTTARAGL
jgi:hypothetical protein